MTFAGGMILGQKSAWMHNEWIVGWLQCCFVVLALGFCVVTVIKSREQVRLAIVLGPTCLCPTAFWVMTFSGGHTPSDHGAHSLAHGARCEV
jgi:hypothetical protein